MPKPALGLVVAVCVWIGAEPAAAQDVNWRRDYGAARKEAATTGRPLLLDFGTESCFWCKKLDATTFRLPAVAAQLNVRFIPVKIDAEKDVELVRAAQVDSYPTLLLVGSDGKIIARHVGYADGAQLAAFLAKVPEKAANPAAELFAQAQTDHSAGRFFRCLERCDAIALRHATSPEAAQARRLAAQITADPQKWQQVAGEIDADLASLRRTLDARP